VPAVVILALAMTAVSALVAQKPAWREAAPGYTFAFPRDHASHPDFKLEWWYYTGNLETSAGRRFGYQVTYFRVGVDRAPENPSAWAVRDLFMAHLAVSDPVGGRYRYDEKLTRAGPGLSGAETSRYLVWNEDWRAGLDAGGRHAIQARSRSVGVDLLLDEGKRPAINGVNGISQKGAQAGNASHYYSLTRMPTVGSVIIDGERFEVRGESWMDHEFGTSFLEREQQGWDWLSLQLDDGRELMLYQLRRGDGSRDPRSSGTLIDRQGQTRHLGADAFSLVPAGPIFRSESGARYPVAWSVKIPSLGFEARVSTPLRNQELVTPAAGIAYWEGMIDISGTAREAPISGKGYLEMTGYKGSLGRVMTQ
jgi:predicted secreted hydrolase